MYLLDHPNPYYKQWIPRRTSLPSGLPAHGGKVTGAIILHDAEGGTDLIGEDMGAENVARYIATRTTPGSYHVLVDRDTTIPMVPFEYETWHDVASNPYTVGISVAWNKADLLVMTYDQRLAYYKPMVKATLAAVAWFAARGIAVPLDRFLSRAEVMAGKPGLSTHSRMDPTRRTDPFGTGSVFEAEFLGVLAREAGTDPTPGVVIPTPPATIPPEELKMTPEQAWTLNNMNSAVAAIQQQTWAINNALTNAVLPALAGLGADIKALPELDAGTIAALIPAALAADVADLLANRLAE